MYILIRFRKHLQRILIRLMFPYSSNNKFYLYKICKFFTHLIIKCCRRVTLISFQLKFYLNLLCKCDEAKFHSAKFNATSNSFVKLFIILDRNAYCFFVQDNQDQCINEKNHCEHNLEFQRFPAYIIHHFLAHVMILSMTVESLCVKTPCAT